MLSGLNFVVVHVPNLAEARTFYTEKLGLTVADDRLPGFVQFAQPEGHGATFGLQEAADARPVADPELWWYVENADATRAALAKAGVTIASEPKDLPFGRALSVKDPAGNTIYLLQPR
jgi:predicted enzyme related to lactoylglutathione lyase